MFYHANMAVDGLYPGLVSTRSIANLGHFEVEVIITPVQPTPGGGGGWVPDYSGKADRYRVTVRVRFKGQIYEDSAIVDDNQARVTARLFGVEKFSSDEMMVTVNGVQISSEEIKVTAKWKH